MAKFQNHSSKQLIVDLLFITFFSATIWQLASCASQEDEAIPPKTFEDNGDKVKVASQEKLLEEEKGIPKSILDKVKSDLTSENIQKKLQEQKDLQTVRDAAEKASRETDVKKVPYYHPTCPEVKTWLRPGQYYWRYIIYGTNGRKTYKFCYNYWYIYLVECACNYCRINYYNYYDKRYKCLEEYRYEWIPMVCYSFDILANGQSTKPVWNKIVYKYIRLPKDCCCSYYSYYYKNQQCAIPS